MTSGSATLTIFRGQKHWNPGETLTAASLRRGGSSTADSTVWIENLLRRIHANLAAARAGDKPAHKELENLLLVSQQAAAFNPFVSFSQTYSVAVSFALGDDKPGFVLTVSANSTLPQDAIFDYEAVREELNLFGDAMDYLKEIGIPRDVGAGFAVSAVDELSLSPDRKIVTTRIRG